MNILCERCGATLDLGAWMVEDDMVCEACMHRDTDCEYPVPVLLCGGQGRDAGELAGDALGAATIGAVCVALLAVAGCLYVLFR